MKNTLLFLLVILSALTVSGEEKTVNEILQYLESATNEASEFECRLSLEGDQLVCMTISGHKTQYPLEKVVFVESMDFVEIECVDGDKCIYASFEEDKSITAVSWLFGNETTEAVEAFEDLQMKVTGMIVQRKVDEFDWEDYDYEEVEPYNGEAIEAEPYDVELDFDATTIEFEEEEYDFGEIKQGDVVEHVFKFKNTGEHPLIITNARGSCGCTVPSYPEEAIPPGETGEIFVKFDSKGKMGVQHKSVTITANTIPETTRLSIKGDVIVNDEVDIDYDEEIEIPEPLEDAEVEEIEEFEIDDWGGDYDYEDYYKKAVITFDNREFDFGVIAEGTEEVHAYGFTNTGDATLYFNEVSSSCACLELMEYPSSVEPGRRGQIVVRFDATGRDGKQYKIIRVDANTDPSLTRLVFSGIVDEGTVPMGDKNKQTQMGNTTGAVIEFDEMKYKFGKIKAGDVVEKRFVFTNTGDEPLIILSANASCGCTVPEWPREPINPGETAYINVKFDSKGKAGHQHKSVTITANTDPQVTKLTIEGEVETDY